MNKYELLTIFSASLNDEQKDAIVDKYSKLLEKNGIWERKVLLPL